MTLGVSARGISFEVGGHRLLSSVTLEVPTGAFAAVVGPSGAGKSTLLKVLCGLREPASGRAQVMGADAREARGDPAIIGYVPQDDIVPRALRVQDVLRYATELRLAQASVADRDRRVEEVLALVDLAARREVRVRRLSGGQRKRVSIAVELITQPGVLFLDEPTSGLDPGLERQLMSTLASLARDGRTVVMTTHVMESMEVVDLLAVVCDGHLAFVGPPSAALGYFRVENLRDIFTPLKRRSGSAWHRTLERRRSEIAPCRPSSTATPPQTATSPATNEQAPSIDAALRALKQRLEGGDG